MSEAKAPAAGALDDPMVMYRDWGTPLRQPWNLNQAQNMLMVQQTFPGFGKRAARSQVAGKEIEVAKLEVEAVRREVAVRVRKAFLDLLRSSDDRRIHDAQVRLTREALSSAQVKYTVGKAPQQDVLKAQIALTKLARAPDRAGSGCGHGARRVEHADGAQSGRAAGGRGRIHNAGDSARASRPGENCAGEPARTAGDQEGSRSRRREDRGGEAGLQAGLHGRRRLHGDAGGVDDAQHLQRRK